MPENASANAHRQCGGRGKRRKTLYPRHAQGIAGYGGSSSARGAIGIGARVLRRARHASGIGGARARESGARVQAANCDRGCGRRARTRYIKRKLTTNYNGGFTCSPTPVATSTLTGRQRPMRRGSSLQNACCGGQRKVNKRTLTHSIQMFQAGPTAEVHTTPPPPPASAGPSAARWRATRLPGCTLLGAAGRKGRVDSCVRLRRGLRAARGSDEP